VQISSQRVLAASLNTTSKHTCQYPKKVSCIGPSRSIAQYRDVLVGMVARAVFHEVSPIALEQVGWSEQFGVALLLPQ
jgi:hypothetical protein